jgi:hypothetical protein
LEIIFHKMGRCFRVAILLLYLIESKAID